MTITKERLLKIQQWRETYGPSSNVVLPSEEAEELARIALASLEAEPVCYLTWHQGFRAPDDCEEYVVEAKPGDTSCDGSPAFPVCTAPPVPVSVPAAYEKNEDFSAYHEGWNACRAAMLQGAGGALTNEDTKRVDELVMWIKRLAHSLRKANPDSKLQSDAMDYLSRKGLIGVEDILR